MHLDQNLKLTCSDSFAKAFEAELNKQLDRILANSSTPLKTLETMATKTDYPTPYTSRPQTGRVKR